MLAEHFARRGTGMAVLPTFSSQDLAKLLDINVSTVKRLADSGQLRCVRTPGGHRRFRVEDVRAFVGTQGIHSHTFAPIIDETGNGERHQAFEQAILERRWERLQEHLIAIAGIGTVREVTRLLVATQVAGVHPAELCDHVISPVMREVGNRWATNRITVADEHLISHTIAAALAQTLTHRGERSKVPYRALCGCLAPDSHEMGCQCVALVLTFEGWEVATLGASTPVESFVSAIEKHRPDLICLSTTVIHDPVAFRTDCEQLAHAAHSCGCPMVIGGSAVFTLDLSCPHELVTLIRDMGGLVEYVCGRFGRDSCRDHTGLRSPDGEAEDSTATQQPHAD